MSTATLLKRPEAVTSKRSARANRLVEEQAEVARVGRQVGVEQVVAPETVDARP